MHANHFLWLQQCPLPCQQTVYDVKVNRYHKNNLVGHDEHFVNQLQRHGAVIGFRFETFAVHKHVETLVIDTGSFLSQVGGNLGLFLGVSCLSILTGIIQISRRAIEKWK